MQRCFFLFFLILSCLQGKGQNSKILNTEFSLWYVPEHRFLKANTLIKVKIKEIDNEISFIFLPDSIRYIKMREGRLKGELPYAHKDEVITIAVPEGRTQFEIELEYYIDIENEDYSPFILQKEDLFSVNPYNAYRNEKIALPGMLFPQSEEGKSTISVNLTFPEEYNTGTIGTRDFRVIHENGLISDFWSTAEPVPFTGFFLFAGTFPDFDLKELDAKYAFSEMDMGNLKAFEYRERYASLIRFLTPYSDNTENVGDYLIQLDSLSNIPLPGFYLHEDDVSSAGLTSEKWLTFLMLNRDTLRSSHLHFLYHAEEKGSIWKNSLMARKWKYSADGKNLPKTILHTQALAWAGKYDSAGVARYLRGDTVLPGKGRRHEFLKSVYLQQPQQINISYRYKENTQFIYAQQDTSRSFYSLPLDVKIYTPDSTISTSAIFEAKEADTLGFSLSGSPRAVKADFGPHFPAFINDQSPDSYHLYQLGNAESNEERIEALRQLFQTKNANLFSTALGIAMDDHNPNVRLEALERSDDLLLPAQLKLKDTLIKLATSDPDERVRERARLLVDKYYRP